jgi:hypothetical protein
MTRRRAGAEAGGGYRLGAEGGKYVGLCAIDQLLVDVKSGLAYVNVIIACCERSRSTWIFARCDTLQQNRSTTTISTLNVRKNTNAKGGQSGCPSRQLQSRATMRYALRVCNWSEIGYAVNRLVSRGSACIVLYVQPVRSQEPVSRYNRSVIKHTVITLKVLK